MNRYWNGIAVLSLTFVSAASAGTEVGATAGAPLPPQVIEADVNGPVAEVWKVFSTAEGFKKLGVAQCEFDLRIGGLIRTHYDPNGVLGDDGTIVNEVLAYEPERMIAIRIHQPPKGFPFAPETWKNTWSVITLTDLGAGRTHVRIAGMGYTDSPDSRKMREFFAGGNAWVMQFLQKQFDAAAPAPGGSAHGAVERDAAAPDERRDAEGAEAN